MARKRRTDRKRVQYPVGVLSDPTAVERFAVGVATAEIGQLTDSERRVAIAIAHAFSGMLIDLREENDRLADTLMELQRLMGG